MKYLYVCTSGISDFFLEQTFASIVSLRTKTSNAFVSLIIDRCTEKTLTNGRENIRKIVDELIVVDLDENFSAKYRSRILKTSMRNLVEGDFLFIDSDTVVLDDLKKIEAVPFEFAGVLDCHSHLSDNPQERIHKKLMRSLCSDASFLNNEKYINSGVLLVRDTLNNRNFFKQWNECYQSAFKSWKIAQDQPTFSLINYKNNDVIKEIDGSWNCQLNFGGHLFRSAKILHFFASTSIPETMQNLYNEIRQRCYGKDAIHYVQNHYETAAFDFGHTALVKGVEYKILNTALYRLLVYLFSTHKKIFSFFEGIASLGRGRGFYYKTKK